MLTSASWLAQCLGVAVVVGAPISGWSRAARPTPGRSCDRRHLPPDGVGPDGGRRDVEEPCIGAGLRELMDRMGHSTARAGMVNLYATDERQRAIADALSELAEGRQYQRSSAPRARSGLERPECFMKISHRQAELTAGLGV